MDGAMGQEEEDVEAVLTCEGDYHDPQLASRIERFRHRLKDLLLTEKQKLQIKKVEPWNSVKVTFTIPRGAAVRLRQLAQNGNDILRQMGVLAVQIQGDSQIPLSLAGRSYESSTPLIICAPAASQPSTSVSLSSATNESDDFRSSQAPNSGELRKNFRSYMLQGSSVRQNSSFLDGILEPEAPRVSAFGMGLEFPQHLDTVAGLSVSSSGLRPNSITPKVFPNPTLKGGNLHSNYSFMKTSGAFQPPVPRPSFSGGQSSSSHHSQPGMMSAERLLVSLGSDGQSSQSSLSHTTSSAHVLQHNLSNSFSPVSSLRLSPVPSAASLTARPHYPASSSPTASFMIDLPPPPPYPTTGNSSRTGKPVTSSSPLLVNLLQTDPLMATVGLASGNPNKPLTAGEAQLASSPKRKQRSRKMKEATMKPISFNDNAATGRSGVQHHFFNSDTDSQQNSIRLPEETIDLIQSRASSLPVNHIPDPFVNSHTDSKAVFSLDRPLGDSQTGNNSGDYQSGFSKSAIRTGYGSFKLPDSNRQETFLQEFDPFSMDITAGKIINPYTGQLEPRDSVIDSGQVPDPGNFSQGDKFATLMLAKKAKELKKVNDISVPISSSSQLLDVHVMRTAVPSHSAISSTAALVPSGGPFKASIDRCASLPAHQRNMAAADGLARERDSVLSSIYAVNSKPWQDEPGNSDGGLRPAASMLTNPSFRKVSSDPGSMLHKKIALSPVSFNGPLSGTHLIRPSKGLSQQQNVVSSSGIRSSSLKGSVISATSVTVSSPIIPPTSHPLYVAQTTGQLLEPNASTSFLTSSSSGLQNLVHSTSSSSVSIARLGLSSSSSTFSSSPFSVVHRTERNKASDSSHELKSPIHQHSQAASEGHMPPTSNSLNLLNSLPERHMDSQSSVVSPTDKTSSEGDENSNHSGMITDTLPEHSGTAALLEHSGVKADNHDSGVGSSSERSDDTPSEPGDSEFRSGHNGADLDVSVPRTGSCKLESKLVSGPNTITVGYMVHSSDGGPQARLVRASDPGLASGVSALPKVSDMAHFFQSHHSISLDKQTSLASGMPHSSVVNMDEDKGYMHSDFPDRIRENGQTLEERATGSNLKLNGPSSQSNIEKMIKTMSEMQYKKMRVSPKQSSKKGFIEHPGEHLKLQAEVFEKMNKLHQFSESAKEASVSTTQTTPDGANSPDALAQRLNLGEDKPDQILFDIEELVNGKTLGHVNSGLESKGGSNITSIYSKRSSPVNVNMLNHIYAPGLPLPRRLTESVQRLVKPLPATETSVSSYPQMRPCKSPGSGGSPRASSGGNVQSSMRMSGVRSPGASMPKLIPSDKHSLISGGLDLAGVSSLQYAPTVASDHSSIISCKRGSPSSGASMLPPEPSSYSASRNSPPNLQLDSKPLSGKMLSQSFPPHKSRDLKQSVTHMNHSLFSNLPSNSSFVDKKLSSVNTSYHSHIPRLREEPLPASTQDSRCPISRSQQMPSHRFSPILELAQERLAPQMPLPDVNTHSTCSSYVAEYSSAASTSHSNASSPIMPVLHWGQEPPLTPTVVPSMPSLYSQPPSSSSNSSATEISLVSAGSSASSNGVSQNKPVPYSHHLDSSSSGTLLNYTAKLVPVSSSVPTLSPVLAAPPSLGEGSTFHSAPPRLLQSSVEVLPPPKLKKAFLSSSSSSNTSSKASKSGQSGPQFSRNLFESVSGTLSREGISHGRSEQYESVSGESISLEINQLTAYKSDSSNPNNSLNSVLISQETQASGTQHKSVQGADKRTEAPAAEGSKVDYARGNSVSKQAQACSSSPPAFLSTKVVNLDFPSSLPSEEISVSLEDKPSSSRGVVVKTNSPVSDPSPLLANRQSPNLSSAYIDLFPPQFSHNISLSLTTSPVLGKDEAAAKSLPAVTPPTSVTTTEPILEKLAWALGSTIHNKVPPGRSSVEKSSMSDTSPPEPQRSDETTGQHSTTISHSIGLRRSPLSLEISLTESATTLNSLQKKLVRKRKSSQIEDEANHSDESPPIKKQLVCNLGILMKSSAKSPTAEKEFCAPPADTQANSDSDVGDFRAVSVKCAAQLSHTASVLSSDTLEINVVKPDETSVDIMKKEASCCLQPAENAAIASTETAVNDVKEAKPKTPEASVQESSDDSRASVEDLDKGSRTQSSDIFSDPDVNKEGSVHQPDTPTSLTKEKDASASPVILKLSSCDDSHIDIIQTDGVHVETGCIQDAQEDHADSSLSLSSSLYQPDGEICVKDVDNLAGLDKNQGDSKHDEGHKKGHRVKRQFYAYVPEKSIDQTYFDTPILSGRTRSKNKPSDLGQDMLLPAEEVSTAPSGTEANQSATSQQPIAVKTEGASLDKTGGKRPVRSVRAKDNSQDSIPGKRRKVHQHR